MKKEYTYFSHHRCEYFPCHAGADPHNFNCLFCYCPLYVLGDQCGGQFTYLPNRNKDCSQCLYPHLRENYDAITGRYREIMAHIAAAKKRVEGDAVPVVKGCFAMKLSVSELQQIKNQLAQDCARTKEKRRTEPDCMEWVSQECWRQYCGHGIGTVLYRAFFR